MFEHQEENMELESSVRSYSQTLKRSYQGMSDEMQQCIENCLDCHKVCEQLIPYCLNKGGMHAERKHIQALADCAEICRTSAHFMMWNSDLHAKVCGVCSEACIKCAIDCEGMSSDDMMKMCASVCRKCADSCRAMSLSH
jgi:hypothetical protein